MNKKILSFLCVCVLVSFSWIISQVIGFFVVEKIQAVRPQRSITTITITHGPLVGGVTHEAARIFGRLTAAGSLQVEYATDSAFTTSQFSNTVSVTATTDYTGIVDISGLSPSTLYYYRFTGDTEAKVYQLTTFPDPSSTQTFSFAVFADASQNDTYDAPVYTQAVNDGISFALQIGDFRHDDPGQSLSPITIQNWYTMNKKSIGTGSVAGLRFRDVVSGYSTGVSIPFDHIWDDHDYAKNNSGRTFAHKVMAYNAFKRYFPTYTLPNPNGGFWHSFRYAQAEFFVLDLRLQRDPPTDTDDSNKSMLDGALIANDQKDWLKDSLLASTAQWKFIISSSVWNTHSKTTDSWYAYQTERNELVDFIQTNEITGVIFITGDIHSGGAIDSGVNSTFPEISVPNTNIYQQNDCTGNDGCGTWDIGVLRPLDVDKNGGYALITVSDEASGSATLMAKGEESSEPRIIYTVN